MNRKQLRTLTETRVVFEDFRPDYNTERPHSSLGYESSRRFAAKTPYQTQAPGRPTKPFRPYV
ncbi:MAG: transposase [Verrucomicrobia bacterium]|nr:transposase [Verrucomicrobiota bacterium]